LNSRETSILNALAPENGWSPSSAHIARAFRYDVLDVNKFSKDSSPTFPERDDSVEQVDFASESDEPGAFGLA